MAKGLSLPSQLGVKVKGVYYDYVVLCNRDVLACTNQP